MQPNTLEGAQPGLKTRRQLGPTAAGANWRKQPLFANWTETNSSRGIPAPQGTGATIPRSSSRNGAPARVIKTFGGPAGDKQAHAYVAAERLPRFDHSKPQAASRPIDALRATRLRRAAAVGGAQRVVGLSSHLCG